jgi:hypothetical protein
MTRQVPASKAELALVDLIDPELGFVRNESILLRINEAGSVVPDLIFERGKIAVFFDGCYWHECPEHSADAHGGKIRVKDAAVNEQLAATGWLVVRIWEHEPVRTAAARLMRLVLQHRLEHPGLLAVRPYHLSPTPRLNKSIYLGLPPVIFRDFEIGVRCRPGDVLITIKRIDGKSGLDDEEDIATMTDVVLSVLAKNGCRTPSAEDIADALF